MDNALIFIDSAFLSKLNHYFGGGRYLKSDIISFSKRLAEKQNLHCKHIYYYNSPPFQSDKPSKEESEKCKKYESFKRKLLKNKIITLREGRCQRLKMEGNFVYRQKGVDALLIMDLMSMPIENKEIKKAILIANDSDFVPVIKKIKQIGIEIILYTHYSKKRKSSFSRSNELLKAVSRYVQLNKEDFEESSMPLEENA